MPHKNIHSIYTSGGGGKSHSEVLTEDFPRDSSVAAIPQNRRGGFTLAEVLVTLAVVGIVASLTIPPLQKTYNEMIWKGSYKKAYSDISRVVVMATNNGEFTPRENDVESYWVAHANFAVLQSYFSVLKSCDHTNISDCWYPYEEIINPENDGDQVKAFIDKQGRIWRLYDQNQNIILVDVNGFKEPNKLGRDRWAFEYADRENNKIGNATDITIPEKVLPHTNDYTVYNQYKCPSPPCYFCSWLYGNNCN